MHECVRFTEARSIDAYTELSGLIFSEGRNLQHSAERRGEGEAKLWRAGRIIGVSLVPSCSREELFKIIHILNDFLWIYPMKWYYF